MRQSGCPALGQRRGVTTTGPRERTVLHAVASLGDESATVKQLAERAKLKNNEIQPLVANLIDKGLVFRPGRGIIAFTAPMFGAFLRRTEPH